MSSGILRAGKYAANAAAGQTSRAASAALSEPLLSAASAKTNTGTSYTPFDDNLSRSREDGDEDEVSEYSEELLSNADAMGGTNIFTTIALSLLVTGGMAAAASAMVAVQSVAVLVMGGICMVNAPTVARKHLGIARSGGLRSSLNNIRKDLHLLRDEVGFLSDSVNDLQAEADVLIKLEQDLETIATQQTLNVNHIVDLVKENEEILSKLKGKLRQMFVAAMAKIIMRSDTDGDMKIEVKELPVLSLRLQIQLDPYGIKLDTRKFETMIREDNSIENVMKFCSDMLFEEEDSDSIGDDDSVDSELTFDFETFCRTLDDEDERGEETKMTKEEKFSMVTVNEKFSKGSVEVARGKRMTLMPSNSKKDMRRQTILKEVKRRQTTLKNRRADQKFPRQVSTQEERRSTRRLSFASGLVVVRGTAAEF